MRRKLIKKFVIKLNIDHDLKDLLEQRAVARQHSFNDEIIATLKNGLSETEILKLQAQVFVDSFLVARERHRARQQRVEKIKAVEK